MRAFIAVLLLIVSTYAGTPLFDVQHTIVTEMYGFGGTDTQSLGTIEIYIGFGIDTATGDTVDFFSHEGEVGSSTKFKCEMSVNPIDLTSRHWSTVPRDNDSTSFVVVNVYASRTRMTIVSSDAVVSSWAPDPSGCTIQSVASYYDSVEVGDDFDIMVQSSCDEIVSGYEDAWRLVVTGIQHHQVTSLSRKTTVRSAHRPRTGMQTFDLLGRRLIQRPRRLQKVVGL